MVSTSLVTGGAGFIGSHVAKALINQNHRVIILDDLSGGCKTNVPDASKLYIGSITDESLVNDLFEQYSFDYVFHLAAYAAEGLSHFIRHFNYTNNLLGSIHLINAAVRHNIKCFVFTSSIAVYGSNVLPMKEQTPPQPEDPYGIAKYAVERDLLAAHNMFGLNSIIFRPHNVYGPHQNIGDKYRNVVGIFMNQILQNKPLTIFGTGEQERAFTYIDDVAPYIAASINHPKAYNHIFNIGSSVVSSVNDLATKVNEAMHSNQKVRYLEKREEVLHAYADHTKFNRIFNPSASTTLNKGLEKTAAWVKKHGARTSTEFNAIELTKNLPESWSKAVSNE